MSTDGEQETRGNNKNTATAEERFAEGIVITVCVAGALALWVCTLGMFCSTASYRDDEYRLTFHGLCCRCGPRA